MIGLISRVVLTLLSFSRVSNFGQSKDPRSKILPVPFLEWPTNLSNVKHSFGDSGSQCHTSLYHVFASLLVESNWKAKMSTMTLATSLNLNDLEEQQTKPKQKEPDFDLKDLFKETSREDDKDSLFEISYKPQHYATEAPDFV